MKTLNNIFVPLIVTFLYHYKDLLRFVTDDSDGIVYSDIVMTTTGPVRGRLVKDDLHKFRYYSYQGIPYAEKPVRFKPPVPKQPWTEVLNATDAKKSCNQFEITYTKDKMSEDCLFLNIFVPEKRSSSLAVLVLIHGGGFSFEPTAQSPVHLGPHLFYVMYDVIVVTINFRLGVLGYFCLDIEEATGNNQLKDILLALKWINANVDRFGGDKDKITLSGFSSGAAAIEYLIMTEKSKGLFQQAILISGSPLSYKMFGKYPKQNSISFANQLGIEDNDPHLILKKMNEIDANHLFFMDEIFAYYENRRLLRRPIRFLPHIEIHTKHALITENPKKLLENGKINDVKILMGISEEEKYCMYSVFNRYTIKPFNDNIELLIPSNIEYPKGSKNSKELAKSIHNFYFNGSDITVKKLDQFALMSGDAQFTNPAYDLLCYYEKFLKDKLYFYTTNFVHDLNAISIVMEMNYTGLAHADLAFYVANSKHLRSKYVNNDLRAIKMSRRSLYLTSNFIKYGDPTPQTYEGIKWPDYKKRKQYLEIGEKLEVKSEFSEALKRRIQFWQKVYEDYDTYVKKGGDIEPKMVP